MLKDTFGNSLKIGDTIIVTVSRKSLYLTTAEILDYAKETGKIYISYVSTPKGKWIDPCTESIMLYPKPLRELYSETDLFKDNAGIKVSPGNTVAWKNGENISIGVIKSIESDLWATLTDGTKVRNTQVLVI